MAKVRIWQRRSMQEGKQPRTPEPAKSLPAESWTFPAENVVRVAIDGEPYIVDVETATDSDGNAVVLGMAIRRAYPLKRPAMSERDIEFADDIEATPASVRDIKRLALDRYLRIALAALADPFGQEGRAPTALPRGRPKGEKWWRDFARAYLALEAEGVKPVAEIAKRKGETENLVHSWVFTARHKLGLLPMSQRTTKDKPILKKQQRRKK